jgi:hypothetical protein
LGAISACWGIVDRKGKHRRSSATVEWKPTSSSSSGQSLPGPRVHFPSAKFLGVSYWVLKKENDMSRVKDAFLRVHRLVIGGLVLFGLFLLGNTPSRSAQKIKPETIEASAMGTGTQLGAVIGVTLIINEYSTPADRQVLVQAFEKGQNQGLVNALSKMRSVGRVEITGTLGNDCSFIRMIPTQTGRIIRFATNRQIRFGEAWTDSPTMSYNLTAGEFNLNDQDKSKSTGVLYPASQLVIDKEGQLQIDLNQNAWRLTDVLDWKGTPGEN